jgi:hypothetical protein
LEDAPTLTAVYDALLRRCPPYRLPGVWADVEVDPAVRHAPEDPAAVIAELAERFPSTILTAAGVARTTADNGLAPSHALRTASPWLFLRPEPHRRPFAVVTPAGCLGGRDLPVLAALKDYATAEALAADPERQLWVAGSTADVAALRTAGLPAALALGLEDFGPRELTALCGAFGWRYPAKGRTVPESPGEPLCPHEPRPGGGAGTAEAADAARSAHGPARSRRLDVSAAADRDALALNLVAWSPARLALEPPAVLGAVRAHLRAVQDHLGVTDMQVGIWLPDAGFLERIAWQLRFDPQAVSAAAILADVERSVGDLLFDRPAPPPEPATYLDAEDQLRLALGRQARGQCGAEEVRRAREQLQDRLDREVLRPLLQRTGSPTTRNLQVALRQVSRLFHGLGMTMDLSLSQRFSETLGGNGDPIPAGQLQQLTALAQTLMALTKGLRQ